MSATPACQNCGERLDKPPFSPICACENVHIYVANLRSQLAEAQRDAQRLCDVERLKLRIAPSDGGLQGWVVRAPFGGTRRAVNGHFATELRAAIDAARSTPERAIGPNNVPIMDALKNALSDTPERGDPCVCANWETGEDGRCRRCGGYIVGEGV